MHSVCVMRQLCAPKIFECISTLNIDSRCEINHKESRTQTFIVLLMKKMKQEELMKNKR